MFLCNIVIRQQLTLQDVGHIVVSGNMVMYSIEIQDLIYNKTNWKDSKWKHKKPARENVGQLNESR